MTETDVVKVVNNALLRTMVGLVNHTVLDHTGLLTFYDVNAKVLATTKLKDLQGVASKEMAWRIESVINIPAIERKSEPAILSEADFQDLKAKNK